MLAARALLPRRVISPTNATRLGAGRALHDFAAAALEDDATAEFRESVRGFAQGQIAPLAAQIDADNSFPKGVDLWRAMGEFGLHVSARSGRAVGLPACRSRPRPRAPAARTCPQMPRAHHAPLTVRNRA